MRKSVWIFSFLTMLVVVFGGVAPALAEATVTHWAWTLDLSGSFWSVCANELVVFEGIGRFRLYAVIDSAGGWHWTYMGSGNLRGVGQVSGTVYQVISVDQWHWHGTTQGFQSEWTFVNTSPSISHGGLVNGMFTIRNHVTVNANGEVVRSCGEFGNHVSRVITVEASQRLAI